MRLLQYHLFRSKNIILDNKVSGNFIVLYQNLIIRYTPKGNLPNSPSTAEVGACGRTPNTCFKNFK